MSAVATREFLFFFPPSLPFYIKARKMERKANIWDEMETRAAVVSPLGGGVPTQHDICVNGVDDRVMG